MNKYVFLFLASCLGFDGVYLFFACRRRRKIEGEREVVKPFDRDFALSIKALHAALCTHAVSARRLCGSCLVALLPATRKPSLLSCFRGRAGWL